MVPGKCYVTEIGQVRRVLEATDGKVRYGFRCRIAEQRRAGHHLGHEPPGGGAERDALVAPFRSS
jgi:hypothetical protein